MILLTNIHHGFFFVIKCYTVTLQVMLPVNFVSCLDSIPVTIFALGKKNILRLLEDFLPNCLVTIKLQSKQNAPQHSKKYSRNQKLWALNWTLCSDQASGLPGRATQRPKHSPSRFTRGLVQITAFPQFPSTFIRRKYGFGEGYCPFPRGICSWFSCFSSWVEMPLRPDDMLIP